MAKKFWASVRVTLDASPELLAKIKGKYTGQKCGAYELGLDAEVDTAGASLRQSAQRELKAAMKGWEPRERLNGNLGLSHSLSRGVSGNAEKGFAFDFQMTFER